MATLVLSPNAHTESTSVDGSAGVTITHNTIATLRGTAGDANQDATATAVVVTLHASTTTNHYTILRRGIFLVDCASLPATAVVTGATFGLYSTAKENNVGLSAGDAALTLTSSDPASHTGLANADFNVAKFGLRAGAYSDTDVVYNDIPTNNYFYWTLNAAALAVIQAKGILHLGVMFAFDADADTSIAWASNTDTDVTVNFADKGSDKPILTITYIIPPTVTSILTDNAQNNGSVSITNLAGTLFAAGATVKLTKAGQSDINATNVSVVSGTKITCDLNLTGAVAGTWNVVVTNTDTGVGTLTNGFTVNNPGTVVFHPDPHPESTSVDGYASRGFVNETFADIIANVGNMADSTNAMLSIGLTAYSEDNHFLSLVRSIVLFDTSIIPAGATVTSATFSITVSSKANNLGLSDAEAGLRLVTSNPATNTDVIAADYGTLGSSGVAADKAYSAIATGTTYNDFTVTDLTVVTKAGITKLGLRLVIDATGGSPAWISLQNTGHLPYSSTQGGVYKPKLAVTWVIPATVAVPKKSLTVVKKTVAVTGAAGVAVPKKALTATKKTVAVTGAATVSIPKKALSVSPKTPTVTGAATVTVTPVALSVATKTITVTGETGGGPATVSVPKLSLAVSVKTPVITGAAVIAVTPKALSVTKKTITITAGTAGTVTVSPKALSVSVHTPVVSGAAIVSAPKKSLTVAKKTPIVSGAAVVSVSKIPLTVTRKTPAVTGAASISVTKRSLYVTRKLIDVRGGAAATIAVPKLSLYVTKKTVIVTSAGSARIAVPVKHLVVTAHAPMVRAGATIIPFPKRLEVDTHVPKIRARTIGIRGWRVGFGVPRGKGLWGFRGYRSGEGDEGERSDSEGTAGDRVDEGSQW